MIKRWQEFFCDNYNLDAYEDEVREFLTEVNGCEPTDDEVWECLEEQFQCDYEEAADELDKVFEGRKILVFGSIGRWNGCTTGFIITDTFEDAVTWCLEDCDYVKIWEEEGHLYLMCSHHDGTNEFEFKSLTEEGYDFYNAWEYDIDGDLCGKRTLKYIGSTLVNELSELPKFLD